MSERQQLLDLLGQQDNPQGIFTRVQVLDLAKANGLKAPKWFFEEHKVARNQYAVSMQGQVVPMQKPLVSIEPQDTKVVTQAKLDVQVDNLVPTVDSTYVPFGFSKDLTQIIKSGIFYPTFISGLSGNGKTTMVEQTCAKLKREAIRANISIETDEDDLIGGNTLVDGNVVYRDGPVLTAMKRGAVLILDELDRGSNKLMCLQAILEGKPYFNKKTGEVVQPAPGFNIVATANTKGRGSDDGKFMSAQILDEAFLERFAITVEQAYPSMATERKIILGKMGKVNKLDEDFAEKLVTWADVIRKTFYEGAIDELVSTRRLEHIVNAFAMFDDRMKAIELCVNRFDEDTKTAFIELYTKVDAEAVTEETEEETSVQETEEVVSDF